MQAVILAGGLGTRLRSVVHDRNKVVAPVAGRPFIAFLIDELTQAGINEIIICSGHKGQDLINRLATNNIKAKLSFSREHRPMGTAGALRHAAHFMTSDTVLVLNGDSHCNLDLRTLIQKHQSTDAVVTLAAVWVPDVLRYGHLEIDVNGKITAFIEKQQKKGGGYINGGIYIIERRLIETIPENQLVSLETDMFPCWIRLGIQTYLSKGPFIDIGTPESYLSAQSYFQKLKRIDHQNIEETIINIEE